MIHYFVYDQDGNITRTGTTLPQCLLQQADSVDGETVRQGRADALTQRWNIKKGELEDKPIVPPTTQELWDGVKANRNMLLSNCDWTQMPDVAKTTQDLWKPYRQALRDITLQPDPSNITWPTPPV